MKIAILGFARDGKAAYQHWNQPDNQITICDQDPKTAVPAGVDSQLGPDYLKNLDRFDLLVRSAGLPPHLIAQANPASPNILAKVTGNIDEFYEHCPSPNIIGVTGTKGKGTTSTLIAKMLQAAGKTVHLGGNIGIPALELLKNNIQPDDWIVLEQSSFQLIDQKHSPHIAVCLMIAPEHLNWHADMAEYLTAKQQLFIHQTAADVAIYNPQNDNSVQIAAVSPGQKIPYLQPPGAAVQDSQIIIDKQTICNLADIKLLGEHNLQNICAALTAFWQVSQDAAAARQALTSFAGLPYRLEDRGQVEQIRYYNDSFASVPDATMAAIDAIKGSKVLIVGGFDRMLDLTKLVAKIQAQTASIRQVVLIGQAAQRLAQSLNNAGYHNYQVCADQSMAKIVQLAGQLAQPGDAVLLSPGFPSFDMFKDFKDRGNQFNQAVRQLAGGRV
jgi:UDP-N-acetylmuramoylalanine--D-glutamate ligase